MLSKSISNLCKRPIASKDIFDEKELPKFKGKTHKSDSASLQGFETDFFEACDYIGLFDIK